MNRKFAFILAFAVLSFTMGSCVKSDVSESQSSNCTPNNTGIPTSAEIASLQSYLASNSITANFDSRGFFYIITAPGTGATPLLTSTVTASYQGTLESGVIFAPNAVSSFLLSDLILGWQMGLPLIKKGGSIKLFLPPSLGYRCNATGAVPPGSNLIFTINLIEVI